MVIRERLTADQPAVHPADEHPIDPSRLVPTMLAKRELDYLHAITARTTARGRIVELGCFLGGSTAAIIHARPHRDRPVIVYDQFIAPPQDAFDANPDLAHFNIRPDASFRELYNTLHREHLDQLDIREMRLPENATADDADRLYPDQDPIELLFVDIAKAWGVHLSVARVFYPHLTAGAVLVHQDFGDFRTPWLTVHMHQLRACFEPLDWIRATPSVSFRCTADPRPHLAPLLSTPAELPNTEREAMWDAIVADWTRIFAQDASGLFAAHRAAHALHAHDAAAAVAHTHAALQWRTTLDAADRYASPDWADWVLALPDRVRSLDAGASTIRDARTLADAARALADLPSPQSAARAWKTEPMKRVCWQRINTKVLQTPHRRLALYGAGRHTRWLLDAGILDPSITVTAVLDDHPADPTIAGVPLRRPDQWSPDATLILPSSDGYEPDLYPRVERTAHAANIDAWRVYTNPELIELKHDQAADILALDTPAPPAFLPCEPIAPAAAHREHLALAPSRDWTDTLRARFTRPDWTKGHINASDAAFLFDCIESARPRTIIEIGTASGMSTLAMVLATHHLAPDHPGPIVHSFDLTARCYFDPRQRVGDAFRQAAPDLAYLASFRTNTTARDAGASFRPRSVDLAFIDADHRHPGATLDLLAILATLKDNALVVLHDIDLDAIHAKTTPNAPIEDGPKRLFDAWPFDKVRNSASPSNIGAIRIPPDRLAAVRTLTELLDEKHPGKDSNLRPAD